MTHFVEYIKSIYWHKSVIYGMCRRRIIYDEIVVCSFSALTSRHNSCRRCRRWARRSRRSWWWRCLWTSRENPRVLRSVRESKKKISLWVYVDSLLLTQTSCHIFYVHSEAWICIFSIFIDVTYLWSNDGWGSEKCKKKCPVLFKWLLSN